MVLEELSVWALLDFQGNDEVWIIIILHTPDHSILCKKETCSLPLHRSPKRRII
jgi:hypothetical protein